MMNRTSKAVREAPGRTKSEKVREQMAERKQVTRLTRERRSRERGTVHKNNYPAGLGSGDVFKQAAGKKKTITVGFFWGKKKRTKGGSGPKHCRTGQRKRAFVGDCCVDGGEDGEKRGKDLPRTWKMRWSQKEKKNVEQSGGGECSWRG